MQLIQNYSLKQHNSFGFDIKARYWAEAASPKDLQEALAFAGEYEFPVMVLGEGSNVVIGGDWPGLVLNVAISGKQILKQDDSHVWVRVGAGENWHDFVCWALANRFYGIENLSLIPGSVGAAPIQNIGAYGVELSSCFYELEALCRATGELRTFDSEACQFGYRDSVFKGALLDRVIITQVTFRLSKQASLVTGYGEVEAELAARVDGEVNAAAVAQAICEIRQRKLPDPLEIGNAGSFFKNPVIEKEQFEQLQARYPNIVGYAEGHRVKLAAGWLIDYCGWKGYRNSDIGVHAQQALVLVNYGLGQAEQVLDLAKRIQISVQKHFAITLEMEPRVYLN